MAGTNLYQGQIHGPFQANQEIFTLISKQCAASPKYILHLGIQTRPDNIIINPGALIKITNNEQTMTYEIDKTGMYEVGNTKITSLQFLEDKDNNTIIDYTVVI